jgi:ribosome-associated protein
MAVMIQATDSIALDPRDIEEQFILAGGPGGQNVNKVATAVQLRFALNGVSDMPEDVRVRLAKLAGRRLSREGVIVIRNREDALASLVELVRRAAVVPVKRVRTRMPRAVRERRLEEKARRGSLKRQRQLPPDRG